jgi:hypothetical protein
MLGSSWMAAQLAASQDGLSSVRLPNICASHWQALFYSRSVHISAVGGVQFLQPATHALVREDRHSIGPLQEPLLASRRREWPHYDRELGQHHSYSSVLRLLTASVQTLPPAQPFLQLNALINKWRSMRTPALTRSESGRSIAAYSGSPGVLKS